MLSSYLQWLADQKAWPPACHYPADSGLLERRPVVRNERATTMTNWISNTILAAATLVFAGAASAQTLTAEIPFAFRVNGALLAPGAYHFVATSNAGGYTTYAVRNVDSRQSVL